MKTQIIIQVFYWMTCFSKHGNVQDRKIKAASTYNLASDHFNDHPLSFWDFHGRNIIEHLSLNKGDIILDVGCGAGASAIPAAEMAGEEGKVIIGRIDLAEKLLEYGQKKAAKMNLKNVEFRLVTWRNLKTIFLKIIMIIIKAV
jgi:ubiquinone/menaquinone biosynthesis C-methylase UbiE